MIISIKKLSEDNLSGEFYTFYIKSLISSNSGLAIILDSFFIKHRKTTRHKFVVLNNEDSFDRLSSHNNSMVRRSQIHIPDSIKQEVLDKLLLRVLWEPDIVSSS